jgi:hypothetical protein
LGREIRRLLEGTFDECGFLPLFRFSWSPNGRSFHCSNVRVHLLPLSKIYRRLYRSNQSWPFDLIMRCEDENKRLRKFRPRNSLLVSKSSLPRLLVEVNSKPREDDRPEDLVQILLTGAAIVRFANGFLGRFMVANNFVLFVMYISDHGKVSRFSLFQEPNRPEVCWTFIQLRSQAESS